MAEKQIKSAPKTPKKESNKEKTKDKAGKKKPYIAIIVILLLSTAVTMAVLIVTKNLLGGRDIIIDYLTSLDPAYVTLQEQEAVFEMMEEELTSREESVLKKEAALTEEEAQLEEKEEALELQKVNSSFELYIASLSDERIAQYEQLGTIYSNMESEQAVAAISEIGNVLDMAVVIYYMQPESSAAVFNYMDADLAAQITESLLE